MPDGGRGKRAHARVNGPAGPETPTGPDRGSGPWYEAESALPVHVRRPDRKADPEMRTMNARELGSLCAARVVQGTITKGWVGDGCQKALTAKRSWARST